MKPTWKLYTPSDIHWRLIDKQLSDTYKTVEWVSEQALFCPYYLPVEGCLGADWGIIVNPESNRFGLLTFEHDWCGCPPHDQSNQFPDFWRADQCNDSHEFRDGTWRMCIRPADHKGSHEDHGFGAEGVRRWRTKL